MLKKKSEKKRRTPPKPRYLVLMNKQEATTLFSDPFKKQKHGDNVFQTELFATIFATETIVQAKTTCRRLPPVTVPELRPRRQDRRLWYS